MDVAAAGSANGGFYSLARQFDCTLWAWGDNSIGELGQGYADSNLIYNTPRLIPTISDCAAIAAGTWHILALRADGSLWSWGYNSRLCGSLGCSVPK